MSNEQQAQKPVAWRAWFDEDHGARWLFTLWPDEERLDVKWEPLFTAPPMRDLTDAELFAAAFNFDCGARHENEEWLLRRPSQLRELANNILAKAREKV